MPHFDFCLGKNCSVTIKMPLPCFNRFGITRICVDLNEFQSEIPPWPVLHRLAQRVARVRHSLKIVEGLNEMGLSVDFHVSHPLLWTLFSNCGA